MNFDRNPLNKLLNGKVMETRNDDWNFYLDKANLWRWKRKASNGRIVGASTQGYKLKADCISNAKRNGWR